MKRIRSFIWVCLIILVLVIFINYPKANMTDSTANSESDRVTNRVTDRVTDRVTGSAPDSMGNSVIDGVTYHETVVKPGNSFSIKEGVLTGYSGNVAEVTIPNTVTSIGASVFEKQTEITKVIIPNSVVSIDNYAFAGCKHLTDIDIADTVISIEHGAFLDTSWLISERKKNPLVIVNGILIDGYEAKGDVSIPDCVTSISEYAFQGNSKIINITIPNSVTCIGACAFSICYNLKTVSMTNSVTSIGGEAFSTCPSLTDIKLSNSITQLNGIFEGCKSLKSITLPSSLKSIKSTAFRHCKKLNSVTVPNTLDSIDDLAFRSCGKELTFYGEDNRYISSYVKNKNIKYKTLVLNKTEVTIFKGNKLKLELNSLADCTWKSSDNKIATISSTGKVTAMSQGNVTITALLYGKEYKCSVTVK